MIDIEKCTTNVYFPTFAATKQNFDKQSYSAILFPTLLLITQF